MLQRPPEDSDLRALDDAKFVWGSLAVPILLVVCVLVAVAGAFGLFSDVFIAR